MNQKLAFGIAADLLAQGAIVERLSLVLTLAGLGASFLPGGLDLGLAVVVLGLLQAFVAARVGLDARLFARLAAEPDLAAFDAAMLNLGLLPPAKAGRPGALRIAGARRLLRLQVGVFAGQAIVLLLGMVLR